MILGWYCKEKSDAGHAWGLKGKEKREQIREWQTVKICTKVKISPLAVNNWFCDFSTKCSFGSFRVFFVNLKLDTTGTR